MDQIELPKVLIVDDITANLIALKAVLSSEEIELFSASSGNEALSLCLAHNFALVLMDICMPDMDGVETVQLLKNHEMYKDVPIIFLTGDNTDDFNQTLECFEAGGVDYLQKPLNDTILLAKVRFFLKLFSIQKNQERDKNLLKKANISLEKEILERKKVEQEISDINTNMVIALQEITTIMNGLVRKDFSVCIKKESWPGMDELKENINKTIKELEQGELNLKEANAQLIQSAKLSGIGEMVSGVAHELAQPLNGIKIICQSLQKDIAKDRLEVDELNDDMGEIVEQTNKMAETIDHMRRYSRCTTGEETLLTDVNHILEVALKLGRKQVLAHDIELKIETSPDLPKILVNPIELEQVLLNLIRNAWQAIEEFRKDGGLLVIKTFFKNDKVFLTIKDNGGGIKDDLWEKIFDPFFTTKPADKGTGIGLSISKKIVKKAGGEITVETEQGEGTVFNIILPSLGK